MWEGVMDRRAVVAAGLAAVVGLGGCRDDPAEPPAQPIEPQTAASAAGNDAAAARANGGGGDLSQEPGVEAVRMDGVPHLTRYGDVYFAGQPGEAGFEELRRRGVAAVINLRSEGEMTDRPEEQTVEGLGMAYHHLPIDSPAGMSDEVLDRGRSLLREHGGEPVLVHCASATRVGALWLAKRVVDDGVAWDAAAAEAEMIGLGPGAYRERVREYVEGR